MLERVLGLDVPSAAADHDGKLALEIEVGRDRRADHLAVVADERVGEAG